jgi:hypothetical protein
MCGVHIPIIYTELQNDVSTALEAKKNHAVALLEGRIEADKTAILMKEREDKALALAQVKF